MNRRLGAAAGALAAGYVAAQGRRLSLAARRSCDGPNWLSHREPRAPRPVCALLLELLAAAEAEVVQLVDDGGARSAGTCCTELALISLKASGCGLVG